MNFFIAWVLFLFFYFLVWCKELIEELLILWSDRHIDNSIAKSPRGHHAQIPDKDGKARPVNSESGPSSFFQELGNCRFLFC